MRQGILRIGSALLLLPALVVAQFGLGGIVSDPIQEGHSAEQLINDINKLQQLVKTYNMITTVYNQLHYASGSFSQKLAWLGVATRMINSNTLGGFGETGGWSGAVNQGVGIPGAYTQATYAMMPPALYSQLPIGNNLTSAVMASVRIADGVVPAAMMTIANARLNQPQNDLALSRLESDSQDTTPGTNSEVEQLNLANGGIVLVNRQLESLNALTAAQTEQQLLANKMARDSLSDSINFQGGVDLTYAGKATAWGGSATTISNW